MFRRAFSRFISAIIVFITIFAPASAEVYEGFVTGEVSEGWKVEGTYYVNATGNFGADDTGRLHLKNASSLTYVGEDGEGKNGGLGTASFYYALSAASYPQSFVVEVSIDGDDYVQLGDTITPVKADASNMFPEYYFWSYDVNTYKDNVKFRIRTLVDTSRLYAILVDCITLTDLAAEAGSADGSFNIAEYDFGRIEENTALDAPFVLTNSAQSSETLTIGAGGLVFTGGGASRFSFMGIGDSELAPGESATLVIRYEPGADGVAHEARATLECNDVDPPQIELSGSYWSTAADLAELRAMETGQYVKLTGAVTASVKTNGLSSGDNRFFVQDASGDDGQTGLMINDPDYVLARDYARGERLQGLEGETQDVDGTLALVPALAAESLGTSDAPAATELDGSESFEDIEGELVAIADVFCDGSGVWTAGASYAIGRPSNCVIGEIYVGGASALAGGAMPETAQPKDVTGLAAASTANASTRILPRDGGDLDAGGATSPQIEPGCGGALDFGEWHIARGRMAHTIELTNTGNGPLAWDGDGIAFSGTDAGAFSAASTAGEIGIIWPDETTTLTLYMDPDEEGAVEAILTLSTNAAGAPQYAITLSGEGVLGNDASWDQYAGGPEHQGRRFFDATVTKLDKPLWQTGNENLMASASPCVIEDDGAETPIRVYCWGADGTGYDATRAFVKCFDGETGERLWTSGEITDIGYSIGFDSWHSMAACSSSGRVFLGMGSYVYCFDAGSGERLWQSGALRVDDGGVAVICNATCTVGAKYVYQTTYTGFGGTNYVQAFDIEDGSEAWYYAGGGQGQETVIYHEDGERAYLYRTRVSGSYPDGGTGVSCHNAETGELIWNNEAPLDGSSAWWTESANYGGISFYDGQIFAPTYNFGGISELVCVDAYTGALVWENENSLATDGVPVVLGSRVYIPGHYDWYSGPSYVAGFKVKSGTKNYQTAVSTGNNMWNTCLAATNDIIYATEGSSIYGMSTDGLHLLDPDTGEDLCERDSLAQRVRGSVAIGSDGAIYALMDTDPDSGLAHLICYRAPSPSELVIEDQDSPMHDGFTTHHKVTLYHNAENADEMRIYEDGETAGDWIDYNASSAFTLSDGDGLKTVRAEYGNGSGEAQVSATIWVGVPAVEANGFMVADCDGDMPEGQTDERTVAIEIEAGGAVEMAIYEEDSTGEWVNYSSASTLTLSSGYGTKTVYCILRNPSGETETLERSIELVAPETAARHWEAY